MNTVAASLRKAMLLPPEKTMLVVAMAAAAIDIVLIAVHDSRIDWPAYGGILVLIGALLMTGFFYRTTGRSERIAAATIGAALFIFFTLCLSMFNYQLLPLWRAPIDAQLNAIDRIFGYHWPSVIEWASRHLVFNTLVRYAYLATLPLFALTVVILGLTGRIRELHILMTALLITATFTICLWGLFPSLGAQSLYELPVAVEKLAKPELGTAYGKLLLQLAKDGPGLISPQNIKGLIGFPSYHIVLAVLVLCAVRNIKWVFAVFFLPSLLVVPGIFMHGGHHLVDLPAGILVAVSGIYLARKSVCSYYRKHDRPEFIR